MSAVRIDQLMVDLQLAESRSKAKRWVESGRVSADGVAIGKASQKVALDAQIEIANDDEDRFVSRAGQKLEAVLAALDLDVSGFHCMDVGASAGGFTDCLLQRGAAKVVCVDVGHGQLAPTLLADERVENHEGINARELPHFLRQARPEGFDILVMDVSFISQRKILPGLRAFLRGGGYLISLVKPQFEVGRAALGKGGIVPADYPFDRLLDDLSQYMAELGIAEQLRMESPIKGGDGNREFLIAATARAPGENSNI